MSKGESGRGERVIVEIREEKVERVKEKWKEEKGKEN